MSDAKERPEQEGFSLARWSRRKHEAARPTPAPSPAEAVVPAVAPAAAPAAPAAAAAAVSAAEAPLPAVESLTFESDFTAFLAPKVEEGVKRAALRKLFSDPRFNVMDGLDVYIDDYSKPDPVPEGMLAKLEGIYDKLAAQPKEEVPVQPGEDVPGPPEEATVAAAPPAEPAAESGDEIAPDVSGSDASEGRDA